MRWRKKGIVSRGWEQTTEILMGVKLRVSGLLRWKFKRATERDLGGSLRGPQIEIQAFLERQRHLY